MKEIYKLVADMDLETGNPAKQMFWGNIMLVCCCAFYLLWWILAFKPSGAVKGMKSGWLLIPAAVFGIAAVAMIIRGACGADVSRSFFSAKAVLLAGAAAYAALLAVTTAAFHRQVTTELFLIVGWAALAFFEGNAIYGIGGVSRAGAVCIFIAVTVAAVASIACYVMYYGLDGWAGYIDGMIPLVLAAVFMAVFAVLIALGKIENNI